MFLSLVPFEREYAARSPRALERKNPMGQKRTRPSQIDQTTRRRHATGSRDECGPVGAVTLGLILGVQPVRADARLIFSALWWPGKDV